jgi:hypothetical protein
MASNQLETVLAIAVRQLWAAGDFVLTYDALEAVKKGLGGASCHPDTARSGGVPARVPLAFCVHLRDNDG